MSNWISEKVVVVSVVDDVDTVIELFVIVVVVFETVVLVGAPVGAGVGARVGQQSQTLAMQDRYIQLVVPGVRTRLP